MPIFCDYFSDRPIFHWRRDITGGIEHFAGTNSSREIVNSMAFRNLSYLDPEYDFWKFSFWEFFFEGFKNLFLVWQGGMQNSEFTTDK